MRFRRLSHKRGKEQKELLVFAVRARQFENKILRSRGKKETPHGRPGMPRDRVGKRASRYVARRAENRRKPLYFSYLIWLTRILFTRPKNLDYIPAWTAEGVIEGLAKKCRKEELNVVFYDVRKTTFV